MKLLVLGKSGQLARCLQDIGVADADLDLMVWGRDDLDLAEADDIAARVAGAGADCVINAAAYTAVDRAEEEEDAAMRLNAHAPGEIAKGAAQAGVPVIHVSTDYVFDGTSARSWREDDPVAPLGVYGRTKLAGEEAVRAAHPRHLIARTAWVYSVYGSNFVKTMMRLANKPQLTVVDDQIGSPTAADDLAIALVLAARRMVAAPGDAALTGTFHVAGTGSASWCDVARAVFARMAEQGHAVPSVKAILSQEYPTPAERPKNSRLDCAKFQDTFGHALPFWHGSLRRTVDTA